MRDARTKDPTALKLFPQIGAYTQIGSKNPNLTYYQEQNDKMV